MPDDARDAAFMRMALALARRGLGRTSPNPAVGAVIVRKGRVVARGYHKKAGMPHAEVEAIGSLASPARGATLYVTLEPCCHFGKTPPCTDAIIASGIKRVVVGAVDPNPLVSGKGMTALRAAGVDVSSGVMAGEALAMNEAFVKYIGCGLPFVTLKLATTLDGMIAARGGESRWITGEASRRLVHRMRSMSDVVLVGSNTVLKDDPELDVRLVRGKDPVRVVVDTSFSVPLSARVFRSGRVIVFTTGKAPARKLKEAAEAGVEAVIVRARHGSVDLRGVLRALGRRGFTSVLAEGGGVLAASLIKDGLVDKAAFFVAPRLMGGDGVPSVGPLGVRKPASAPALYRTTIKKIDGDMLIEGYFR